VKNITIELSEFNYVDHLWPELISKFGFEKSKNIISQAMDFQKMNGKKNITIPLIFSGTGGLALISIEYVKKRIPTDKMNGNQIFILNPKKKLFQILNESN
tara:strand:- start:316 stop:618 length:303 start_codon:yes stop_codon:yes gene_type:complete